MNTKTLSLIILTILFTGCAQPQHNAQSVSLIVKNANIYTLDAAHTTASVMIVDGERIIAVGDTALLEDYTSRNTLDVQGQTVLPGFIDTHVHIEGVPPWYVDLTQVDSIATLQQRLQAKAQELPADHWITGYGWSEDEFAEQRKPTRQDLDAITPDNPVMFTRAGAHSAVFSSRALQLAGISADTPDPEGGTIERNPDGSLNGIIRERHEQMVAHLLPTPDPADIRRSLAVELNKLFALGITSITQATGTVDYFPQWEQVYAEQRGRLPRASVQLAYAGQQRMRDFGRRSGDGDHHLRVGPIKIFVDGGFTGPAAFTKEPYLNEATYRGHLNMPEHELRELINLAHQDGWQMGIHAIGDAAIELVVDLLADTLQQHPRADHRHYLNHFTVMPSSETMQTMADLGIAITQQPNFAYTLEGRYEAYLGGERLAHNNPMASPMQHGIHVAMSSDILPLGPWVGIYAATTRKGMSGKVHGPEEKISRVQALRAYTSKGAYLTREEADKGQLTTGMLADFVVYTTDPFSVADDDLMGIQPAQTFLGGQLVFQQNQSDNQ